MKPKITLQCDKCHKAFDILLNMKDGVATNSSIDEFKKNFGWTGEGTKDYCSDCSAVTGNITAKEIEAYQSTARVTLSGGEPCKDYNGPAPCPIDPSTGMHQDYWVLPPEEIAKGFIRPVRRSYIHSKCGGLTRMNQTIAETYARNPKYYSATFCCNCGTHLPVGAEGEFVWEDGSKVGT